MLLKIGFVGSVYLGKEARCAWQSCWMPEARRKLGTHSSVRIEGAEKVMSCHADVVSKSVSEERKRSALVSAKQ